MAEYNFHRGYSTLKNEVKGRPILLTYLQAIMATLQSERCILHELTKITDSNLSNVFPKDINCENRNSNKTLNKTCKLIYSVKQASHITADNILTKFNNYFLSYRAM